MSKRKRSRSSSSNDSDERASKKGRLSLEFSVTENTNFMESLVDKIRNICHRRYHYYYDQPLTINDVEKCLNELSKYSTKEREIIIKKAQCVNPSCNHWSCNYHKIELLLTMNKRLSASATTYYFLFERFNLCNDKDLISLSKQNEIKTNIIKTFAAPSIRGEIYRPYILTIIFDEDCQCDQEYYEGAIGSLQNFTSDTFLNTFKDFNFFHFFKYNEYQDLLPWSYKYIECDEDEVLHLLQSMKKEKGSQTFLLLMFIMTAYFKNFLFDAVKFAVQHSSISDISDINTELNDDVLSIIMSFMMDNHDSLYNVFEDKQLIKQLLKEAVDADEGWQDILADIVQNDQELTDLYEPQMKTYYDSEKLNMLNLKMYRKTLKIEKMKKWLKYSVEYDHYQIYEIILDKHCELKISIFKHIFYQITFKDIRDKETKWFKCIENKIIDLKQILNKNECKRFYKLCDKWKTGIII